ncbi:ModD protein [bacterium]|nr:ModD protein [bacterium]
MIRISDERIDRLIAEDVPYLDLTTELLGIGDEPGEIAFFTREDCVVAGTGVAGRVAERLGATVTQAIADGSRARAGETLLTARGTAAQLHLAWKVSLNVLDHLSGVATRTRAMVDAAHAANPACEVLTTRKSLPGAKDLLTLAVMAGGAWPHRLGLSETVLVFAQHTAFLGGFEGLLDALPGIRARCAEKKVFVEADARQALVLARGAGGAPLVDGIQLDKVPVAELAGLVREIRSIDPRLTLIAAGGVSEANAGAYAATGVDGLATTAPFNAGPVDMSARMTRLA